MENTQWRTAPSPVQTSDEMGSLQAGIGNLPGLSATIQRACNLAENPNASAADLAALIEYDPVLARKLLRLANSASYGAARRISSVTEAVVKLGFSTVRSLAVATSAWMPSTVPIRNSSRTGSSGCTRRLVLWLHRVSEGSPASRRLTTHSLPLFFTMLANWSSFSLPAGLL